MVFSGWVWLFVYTHTASGKLKVAIMDVGQGDAIYIESPTGQQIVIDGGPDNAILRDLPKVMPWFDRSIDVLIETHPHADHVVGFVDLLKRYKVSAFIEPGEVYKSLEVDTLEKEILNEHISRYIARRGMVVDLGGGATLEILYPAGDVTYMPEPKVHEGNVVAKLVYGQTSVLLMGDAPKDVEDMLVVADAQKLKSDILKVGHHGSRTSSGEVFLALVHPTYAAISVGAHNMYKLPNKEPIDLLLGLGAQVFRTDEMGTIKFESDGKYTWRVQ